jgi:uncharacterized protein YndB with AHSA1/START domain
VKLAHKTTVITGGNSGIEEPPGWEVRHEIHIDAAPEIVFALLADAKVMTKWFAEFVEADPQGGVTFWMSESGGTVIGVRHVEAVPAKKVVFTWNGIDGLAPGQSTVEFLLEPDGQGTFVRLRHTAGAWS